MRSSASHTEGPHGLLAHKTVNRGSHYLRREILTQFARQFLTAETAPPLVGCFVWNIHSRVVMNQAEMTLILCLKVNGNKLIIYVYGE